MIIDNGWAQVFITDPIACSTGVDKTLLRINSITTAGSFNNTVLGWGVYPIPAAGESVNLTAKLRRLSTSGSGASFIPAITMYGNVPTDTGLECEQDFASVPTIQGLIDVLETQNFLEKRFLNGSIPALTDSQGHGIVVNTSIDVSVVGKIIVAQGGGAVRSLRTDSIALSAATEEVICAVEPLATRPGGILRWRIWIENNTGAHIVRIRKIDATGTNNTDYSDNEINLNNESRPDDGGSFSVQPGIWSSIDETVVYGDGEPVEHAYPLDFVPRTQYQANAANREGIALTCESLSGTSNVRGQMVYIA